MLVYFENDLLKSKAIDLAAHLNIEETASLESVKEDELFLAYKENGLYLQSGKLAMRQDFNNNLKRVAGDKWRHELLVKATKLKNAKEPVKVIDATAGLGEDSFLLAAAGYEVTMFEYNPIIAALLKDAIERGNTDDTLKRITGRMKLVEKDSISAMAEYEGQVDIVYLDPMFPERSKSGLIKKKFQLLHMLERPCMDEEALLDAALSLKPKRVVIKRPAKGPYVAGVKPDYSITGKAIRYDCIMEKR